MEGHSSMEHAYNIEIVEDDPRANQPDGITTALKPHQLASLHKAQQMERDGFIRYNVPNPENHVALPRCNKDCLYKGRFIVRTNIGIMGDIIGYGKTLTALALIASVPTGQIHRIKETIKSVYQNGSKSYMYIEAGIPEDKDQRSLFATTLVIVPRGPVYKQWEGCITEKTSLRCLAIDDLRSIKKKCPPIGSSNEELKAFFERYDVVLAKNTSIERLIDYYNVPYRTNPIRGFDRLMIDEAHDIGSTIMHVLDYRFAWMITASYKSISQSCFLDKGIRLQNSGEEHKNLMLVKCEKDFTRMSFAVPPYKEIVYRCALPRAVAIVQPFLSKNVLDLVNANDIEGAIRELGGRTETEDNIVNILRRNIQKSIHNKEREREFVLTLEMSEDARAARLNTIANDLDRLGNQMNDLTERAREIEKDLCSICYDDMEAPIILPCSHVFCGVCIMKWIETKERSGHTRSCPRCRTPINRKEDMTAIIKKAEKNDEAGCSKGTSKPRLSKVETTMQIIGGRPDGRFLIFSRHESTFHEVITELHSLGIATSELKGNTHQMAKILERFRNGDLRVILLNTSYAGSGIDISCATDVILFHSMLGDGDQAIGRAHRVGRRDPLTVHRLCYRHEIPENHND